MLLIIKRSFYDESMYNSTWLPCWTALNAANCMPSTLIDAVIADAAVKGLLSGETLETAFEGMEKNANTPSPVPCYGRAGCEYYTEIGYVPSDKHKESVNLTLDAAYCGRCLAVVADILGDKDKLIKKLDEFFDTPPAYRVGGYGVEIHEMSEFAAGCWGQCAISNQPSFHIPFIYAYFGKPEKTSYWVERLREEAFSADDDGFPGDEDNGTTAAWYIFATLGIYPLCPGKTEYVVWNRQTENIRILGKKADFSSVNGIMKYEDILKGEI